MYIIPYALSHKGNGKIVVISDEPETLTLTLTLTLEPGAWSVLKVCML